MMWRLRLIGGVGAVNRFRESNDTLPEKRSSTRSGRIFAEVDGMLKGSHAF
jgi:hypothetical protein